MAFKDIDCDWNYRDEYNGHCPFIVRQYKKVIFDVYDYPFFLEAEIAGQIKAKRTKDAEENECWGFEFFVKNVKEKRDVNSNILIATIIK